MEREREEEKGGEQEISEPFRRRKNKKIYLLQNVLSYTHEMFYEKERIECKRQKRKRKRLETERSDKEREKSGGVRQGNMLRREENCLCQ